MATEKKQRKTPKRKVVILRRHFHDDERHDAVAYETGMCRVYYNDHYDARLPEGMPMLTRYGEAINWMDENPGQWLQVTKTIAKKLGFETFSDEEEDT